MYKLFEIITNEPNTDAIYKDFRYHTSREQCLKYVRNTLKKAFNGHIEIVRIKEVNKEKASFEIKKQAKEELLNRLGI